MSDQRPAAAAAARARARAPLRAASLSSGVTVCAGGARAGARAKAGRCHWRYVRVALCWPKNVWLRARVRGGACVVSVKKTDDESVLPLRARCAAPCVAFCTAWWRAASDARGHVMLIEAFV